MADTDPIALIVASRPRLGDVETSGQGVVATQGETRKATNFAMGDLDTLSGLPGSPGYQMKMEALRQQALARGDPEEVSDITRPMLVLPDAPLVDAAPAAPATRRVAVYHGKNDTYNVAVESAPDWDTDFMFKAKQPEEAELLIDMAKALGVKVQDKTGDF